MSVDKLAAYDNVLGVFADLDDGGLTGDEALAEIRKLVGSTKRVPGDQVILTYNIPIEVTVDLSTGEVTEAQGDSSSGWWMEGSDVTARGGITLDPEEYVDAIERATGIADDIGGWNHDPSV